MAQSSTILLIVRFLSLFFFPSFSFSRMKNRKHFTALGCNTGDQLSQSSGQLLPVDLLLVPQNRPHNVQLAGK